MTHDDLFRLASEAGATQEFFHHYEVFLKNFYSLVIAQHEKNNTPPADAKDARIAELEKDAARYRWLRDKATTNDWAEIGSIQAIPPSKIDAAIDAAMKGSNEVRAVR